MRYQDSFSGYKNKGRGPADTWSTAHSQQSSTTSHHKNYQSYYGGQNGQQNYYHQQQQQQYSFKQSEYDPSSSYAKAFQSTSNRAIPLLYPLKEGNFDILYSEEADGEILVETLSPEQGGQMRLITCIDISTLYKEKRQKAIDRAVEYSKLQHPNLLCITEDFELLDNSGTLLFYTESPDNIAGWKSYCKKKFTTDEMLSIFRQLCGALGYVHDQGIIHRDVHPTRIHSTFGVAKFNLIGMPYNYKKLLKKDNFCGHVNYSAPELIEEKVAFSPKVDIWSLGCCLYYLCTKKDPFEGKSPFEIKQNIMYGRLEKYQSKIDPVLKALIFKCLERDEHKRLDARMMLEYQDQVEFEAYGEVRSGVMVKQIFEQYNLTYSNPLLHQQTIDHLDSSKFSYQNGVGYEKLQNPQFFANPKLISSIKIQPEIAEQPKQKGGSVSSVYSTKQQYNIPPPATGTILIQNQQQLAQTQTQQQSNQQYKNDLKGRSYTSANIGTLRLSTATDGFQNNIFQFYQKQQSCQGSQRTIINALSDNFQIESNDPNRAGIISNVQPIPIVLPQDCKIKQDIKERMDQQEHPIMLQAQNEGESHQIQQKKDEQVHQRFNLTTYNLDKFNSQVKVKLMHINHPKEKELELKNDLDQESKQEGDLLHDSNNVSYSIFKNECIFVDESDDKINKISEDFVEEITKDLIEEQEDPNTSGSRNEINKDEIQDIVASIMEPSHRVKNQMLYHDGTKYVGEVKREGKGIFYDSDGSIYDGEWLEDQKSGQGKMLYSDGTVYDGQWQADKIHGLGIFITKDGDRYEGSFNIGLKDGYGAMYFRNGNTYQGQWKNDQIWGKGVFYFKNGNYYEGNLVKGNFDGQGLMFFLGVGTYKGSFSNGQIEGTGRFDYQNGAIYEGNWRDNRKHGIGKWIDADRLSLYNGEWENDQKHGRGAFIEGSSLTIEGFWKEDNLVEMTNFQNQQP